MANVVYADFNNMDEAGRIRLNTFGTTGDIQKLSLRLVEGMSMVVSDGEIIAKGKVEFSSEENIWVLKVSEDTVQLGG